MSRTPPGEDPHPHYPKPDLNPMLLDDNEGQPLVESFQRVNLISEDYLRLAVIQQEASQFQLSLATYIHQLEQYNQAQQSTSSPKPPLLKPFSILDAKVSDFVAWLEMISIIKLATVLGEAAILIAFISYLFSIPYQQQKKIEDARNVLVDQKGQQHSDGRIAALKTLDSLCASNAGLQAPKAQMVKIQLNQCHKPSVSFRSIQQWPFKFFEHQGIDLSHANLEQANLAHANLEKANLKGSNLKGINLSEANLQGANLQGANLEGANLEGANLQGANFTDAVLHKSLLNNANFTKANLTRAKMHQVQGIWAKFNHATLHRTDLYQANLNRSILKGSDLYKANLENSSLQSVDFLDDANLRSTNLRNADLSKASFWALHQLKRAKHWQSAIKSPNWMQTIARPRSPRLRIGLIKSADSTIFKAYELGMRRAANRRVEIWSLLSASGVENEAQTIQELIDSGIDAIVLSPEDPLGSIPALEKAYQAGVVVITVDFCFDKETAKDMVFACFNTNSLKMGADSAEHLTQWAATHLKDQPLNIGVVDSAEYERYYPNYQGFLNGMAASAVTWKEVSSVDAITQADIAHIKEMLSENPQINILWGGSNLATELSVAAVEDLGLQAKVKVFGILDLSKDKARMLLDPNSPLQSIIDQAGVKIGYKAVHTAVEVLRHKKTQYTEYPIDHRLLTQTDKAAVKELLTEANSIQ